MTKSTSDRLSRRTFVAGTAAAGLSLPFVRRASAQASGNVVVGTWGGDYGRLLRENVDPVATAAGLNVVQDIGDSNSRMAKTAAQSRLPRGMVDVQCFDTVKAYSLYTSGALETIDPSRMANYDMIRPEVRSDFLLPQIISPQVIIYDPSQVDEVPTDLGALLDPKYAGKVGAIVSNYYSFMMAGAIYRTGDPSDFEAGKEFIEEVNANGMRLYAETDEFAQAFTSKAIAIGVVWYARTVMWKRAGINGEAAWPKNGALLYVSGMAIPKNAPNLDAAYAYLDAVLAPQAQQGFAEHMGYMPSITNAGLTGKLAEELDIPADAPPLLTPDLDKLARELPALGDWWKKSIESAG